MEVPTSPPVPEPPSATTGERREIIVIHFWICCEFMCPGFAIVKYLLIKVRKKEENKKIGRRMEPKLKH